MASNQKIFDFKEQLQCGERGEELFLEHYPKRLRIHPDRDGDFIEEHSGRKIELKTDTYNINKSPNFFIERWSDVHREKPGGPWQALEHGCDIFCYMFVRHNIYFQFNDLPALVEKLEDLTGSKGLIYIKNGRWITAGHKVPRRDLEELYDVYEF